MTTWGRHSPFFRSEEDLDDSKTIISDGIETLRWRWCTWIHLPLDYFLKQTLENIYFVNILPTTKSEDLSFRSDSLITLEIVCMKVLFALCWQLTDAAKTFQRKDIDNCRFLKSRWTIDWQSQGQKSEICIIQSWLIEDLGQETRLLIGPDG